ncbi:MAG: hypothetical protein F4X72_08300 [Dehalococcoidia bacterium]|nr:hypothetical protein [Dehalococcoidia bacterium]
MLLRKSDSRLPPAVVHVLIIRSLLLVMLALAAFLFVMLILSSANVLPWRTASAQMARPVIHSVHPDPPYCVLHASPYEDDSLLTMTGENLTAAGGDGRVEFLEVETGTVTGPFSQDVDWLDPRRITVDMGEIGERWPKGRRITLQVRLSSTNSSQLPSNWSDDFVLADTSVTCGYVQPFTPPSPIRGISGDHWADVVIGKPDFTQIGDYNVVPYKVFNPGGVVVDRSVDPGRAYVWDSGNSRILAIDLATCYSGPGPCSADFVLGQPSPYDHAACNGDSGVQNYPHRPLAGPETLCGITEHGISPGEDHTFVTMAVDSQGALYVPDSFNHRILKYENPFETDSIADRVWGQENFSENLCNRGDFDKPTAVSLCFHSASNDGMTNHYGNGVEIDPQGNMWVADGGNNRVLRFSVDQASGEISKTPDLVLGQVDFTSAERGRALDGLHGPSAVRFEQSGSLHVADTLNDRVLVFEPPFESGMTADRTFGSKFHRPTSVEVDPDGSGVWVLNAGNNMVELWDTTGTSVLKVLGKESYQPTRDCGSPRWELPLSPHMCPIAGSIGIDAQGNVLVPVFLATADVFRFPADADESEVEGPDIGLADRRLFYPPPNANFKDRRGMRSTSGIVAVNDQLIVSDYARLMFWNGLGTLENGKPADGVVGDEFFIDNWSDCCGRIKTDESGRLWVLGREGLRYLDVYELPLTEYSVPIHTIWTNQDTFPVLGTEDRITLGARIFGLAPEGNGERIWLSDTDNHRVLRIRDPLTNPVVDVILGQPDANGRQCNQGRFPAADSTAIDSGLHDDVLCYPGALSIDRLGNLYVSDHSLEVEGNKRLLVFPPSVTQTSNSQAVFRPHPTKAFLRSGQGPNSPWGDDRNRTAMMRLRRINSGPLTAATWEPAFDSTNRMVVGYNAYLGAAFVGVYDDPLGPAVFPTSLLYDYGSMPYTATFDENDNLYIGHTNRARVLLYLNPFGTPPPSSTESSAIIPPLPEYSAEIKDINPKPPNCVMRHSLHSYENTLELTVDGVGHDRTTILQIRRVTDYDTEQVTVLRSELDVQESRISIDLGQVPLHRWRDREKVTMTVRAINEDGTPLSNWSPAFVLADSAETCGNEVNLALGPPSIGKVTSNGGFLTVSWNAPGKMGASDIVSYDLRHVPTAADGTVDANWTVVGDAWGASAEGDFEYDVTSLAIGTRYDLQVRAVDVAGPGPWSKTLTGTPKTPSVCFTRGAVADVTNTGLIADCETLLASRDTLARDAYLNWSVDTPIADWDGITVRGNPARVAGLNIRGAGLGGSVPAELGRLSRLTYLNLRNNGLSGLIPTELGNLTNLQYLGLNNNELTGPIPDLSGMTNLEQLYLSNNDLDGSLPDWMGSLTKVRELWLWGNELEGPIPDLSGMTGLVRIKLQSNNFTGSIPASFGDMKDLAYLYLHDNALTGEIPSELGDMDSLRYLWLHTNELEGGIPPELGKLSNLRDLNLHSNNLTGVIPSELGEMTNLTHLRLHRNMLSGAIPDTLGDLGRLRFMWLHGNMLSGQIPAELGSLANLERLWLSENNLSGPIPTEIGGLSTHSLVQWRLAENQLTGCVPPGLTAIEDSDFAGLGLQVCEDS